MKISELNSHLKKRRKQMNHKANQKMHNQELMKTAEINRQCGWKNNTATLGKRSTAPQEATLRPADDPAVLYTARGQGTDPPGTSGGGKQNVGSPSVHTVQHTGTSPATPPL